MNSKIKVLHIIKTLSLGGAEANLLNLLKAVDQERFELHVAYSFGGELEAKFKQEGIRLFKYADMDHKVKSLATPFIVLRLAAYILRHRIRIVHTHTFSAHLWGSAAAKLTGCKIIEHVHDFRYVPTEDFTRRRGFNNQFRFIHRFKNLSDRVIVLTKQNRDFLIQEKIYPPQRIHEYQNGIPLSIWNKTKEEARQHLTTTFGLRSDALIILTPVRMSPEKNVDLILRIAPRVITEVPNAVFLIAGDGPLYDMFWERTQVQGIKNHVKMIGYHPDIRYLLKNADIFLLPSLLELHSIAILEAMSIGVPVVVSEDTGCNSEFITHWKSGVLLDPFKDEGWAEAIIKLSNDPLLRRQIALEGHRTCREKFDIRDVAKKFEGLYVELAEH